VEHARRSSTVEQHPKEGSFISLRFHPFAGIPARKRGKVNVVRDTLRMYTFSWFGSPIEDCAPEGLISAVLFSCFTLLLFLRLSFSPIKGTAEFHLIHASR
jgi:hypothetical protein